MKSIFLILLVIIISVKALVTENYYTGFVEKLGFDAYTSESNIDCSELASFAVYEFRNSILSGYQNIENLLIAVSEIIDKLKYEINPDCITFFGAFEDFMANYLVDPDGLTQTIQQNFVIYRSQIVQVIDIASRALENEDLHCAGKAHATILRTLIGLEKDNAEAEELEIIKDEIGHDNELGSDIDHGFIEEGIISPSSPVADLNIDAEGTQSYDQSSEDDDHYDDYDYLEAQRVEKRILASYDL